jgi:cytochrome c peroxidase
MKQKYFLLAVSLITTSSTFQVHAQSVSMTDIQSVTVSDAGTGLAHWRVERSSNLVDWVTVDAMETLGGTGAVDMSWALQEPVPGYSYRVVSDSSVSNVLTLPATPYPYSSPNLPAHLLDPAVQATINTPTNNPITDAGATLGRVLFYDKKLSANHSISCSSCHVQENGFSDPAVFSVGFDGGLTDRNSMGLSSARFYQRGRFFWDERAATLEIQTLQPIQHAVEMGMTLTGLVSRMQGYEYYPVLFTAAFGDPAITTNRIARALAQFMRSMDSYQSKFDAGVAVGFTNFTPLELQGQQIFNGLRGNCAGLSPRSEFCRRPDRQQRPGISIY